MFLLLKGFNYYYRWKRVVVYPDLRLVSTIPAVKALSHVNAVYKAPYLHIFATDSLLSYTLEEKATETVLEQAAPEMEKEDESSLKLEEKVEEIVSEAAEVQMMEVESAEKGEAEDMERPVESEVTKIDSQKAEEKVDESTAPLYALAALFLLQSKD